jgi:hypothetical protein
LVFGVQHCNGIKLYVDRRRPTLEIRDGGRQTGSSKIEGYKTHKTKGAKVSIGILGSGNPTKFIFMSSDANER